MKKTKVAILLCAVLIITANAMLILHFNQQLKREISIREKNQWQAFMSVLSNGTRTIVSVRFFDKKTFVSLAEMHYLFKGDPRVNDTLEFVDVYAASYQIPEIASYKQISLVKAKPIEDLSDLIIPPFHLNTTDIKQEKRDNETVYVVTVVSKFLFNFTSFDWIPTRTVVFESIDASETIQWTIDHSGNGQVTVSNGTYYLSKPINITRGKLVVSGANFTSQNFSTPIFSISEDTSVVFSNCTIVISNSTFDIKPIERQKQK